MTTLKRGSRGELVKRVQKALCLIPDGIFGPITEEAVIAFQREHGLKADGIVGLATMARLLKLRKSRRNITEIIIHCTATPEGKEYTVASIRAMHLRRGFSDIGYHYVIGRHGELWTGRDVDIQGAHCSDGGGNIGSIGICYIGGLERRKAGIPYSKLKAKDTRTLAQKAFLLSLLMDLRKIYPQAKILGHRDLDTHGKECPSFDAKTEYRQI